MSNLKEYKKHLSNTVNECKEYYKELLKDEKDNDEIKRLLKNRNNIIKNINNEIMMVNNEIILSEIKEK